MDETKSDLINVCHTIHRWQWSKLLRTQQDIKVYHTETKTVHGQGANALGHTLVRKTP